MPGSIGQTFRTGDPKIDLLLTQLFRTLARGQVGSGAMNLDDLGADLDGFHLEEDMSGIRRRLRLPPATKKTIVTGAIYMDQCIHAVDTEAAAATDDLDTVNGGTETDTLVLVAENDARTVVVKHGTGNIRLDGSVDFALDSQYDTLTLIRRGSSWLEIGRGNNGV